MQPLMSRLTLAALLALLAVQAAPAAPPEERPLINVTGPTIIAFFPYVTQEQLKRGSELNEALDDFQWYLYKGLDEYKKRGIYVEDVYTSSFRVRVGGRVSTFRPKSGIGYYFVAPGKKPRVEYDVMSDEDILRVADEYFGPLPKRRAAGQPNQGKFRRTYLQFSGHQLQMMG